MGKIPQKPLFWGVLLGGSKKVQKTRFLRADFYPPLLSKGRAENLVSQFIQVLSSVFWGFWGFWGYRGNDHFLGVPRMGFPKDATDRALRSENYQRSRPLLGGEPLFVSYKTQITASLSAVISPYDTVRL